MVSRVAIVLLILTSVSPAIAAGGLRGPHTSKSFFNPSLGQSVSFAVTLPWPGKLSAAVLDRDGYIIRSLLRPQESPAGETTLMWNGRDDQGAVVPDEAYSFKIDLVSGTRHWTYFPAGHAPTMPQSVAIRSFDPRTGVLSYELPAPSRVHIQAGSAVLAGDGKPDGPVLKTVVDEQPRIGGSVIEQWNGLDESGTIYVPDQPHFVMSLVTAPLPDNSIITVGNRARTFLEYVAHRHGTSLVASHAAHAHHAGLQAVDDVAPPLQLTVANGVWSGTDKAWRGTEAVRLVAELEGPIAARFAKHSAEVEVFVDGKRVLTRKAELPRIAIVLPPVTAPGPHIVAFNWIGRNGPVAVNSLRLLIPPHVTAR